MFQLCFLIISLCIMSLNADVSSLRDLSKLKNVGDENGISNGAEINKGEYIQSPNKKFT